MYLAQGLGLTGGEAVAFIGAGGKTTAMFALAEALAAPVILTTSTHLGSWQAGLADKHLILSSIKDIQYLSIKADETLLLTGPEGTDKRLAGLSAPLMDSVYQYCREKGLSLLIEADGARQRPIKAPADNEPVVPAWAEHVVAMVGMSALGQPLHADTVHRPERFAQLTGLQDGEVIRSEHLVTVLGSGLGGLKGIPDTARRSLFLNQAEGERLSACGARIGEALTGVYDRILIGSLHQPASDGPIFSAHSQTAGIILAAGSSERLGRSKQLLNWNGKPFIVQVANNALSAGLDPVIVVTGADRDRVEAALIGLPIKFVFNPDWALGQSTSLRAGLAVLPVDCDRVMFLLSDQPQISVQLIRALIERHNQKRAAITAPLMRDGRGNPVLFGRETFAELQKTSGDKGGRAVFNRFNVDHVNWIDDRSGLDVDQEDAYQKLIRAYFDI
jgi:molybdenum cofactor cytidylyltransferase